MAKSEQWDDSYTIELTHLRPGTADPNELQNHLLSIKIYGDIVDEEFVDSVRRNGVIVPITVAADGKTVVSGHRRKQAARIAGLSEVPIVICEDLTDPLDIELMVIESNRSREKTDEQKAREFRELKRVEEERAKARQKLSPGRGKKGPMNSSDLYSGGDARDIAATRVGMSQQTAERALKVVEAIDEAAEAGDTERAQELRDLLNNKSVASAYNAVARSKQEVPPDTTPSHVVECLANGRKYGRELVNTLNAALRQIDSFPTAPGLEHLNDRRQALRRAVEAAKESVSIALPHSACPRCNGARCPQCGSKGWVNNVLYRELSK